MAIHGICRKAALLLAGLFLSTLCYSQDDNDDEGVPKQLAPVPPPSAEIFYQGSLQAGGGILYPVTNKALRESLQGIYYLHLSPQYVFMPHYYIGLQLENNQFGINNSVISPYSTNMCVYSAGIKFGYYDYMQHDFLVSYSLSGGLSYIKFNSAPNPAPKGGFNYTAPFITPGLFAGYRVNDRLRIGLELSYLFNFYSFNPYPIGLNQYVSYGTNDTRGITTSFVWGFGVYEAFSEKRTLPQKPEQ